MKIVQNDGTVASDVTVEEYLELKKNNLVGDVRPSGDKVPKPLFNVCTGATPSTGMKDGSVE